MCRKYAWIFNVLFWLWNEIIQEKNNLLLYNYDKYPYMKYFVVQSKPYYLEIKKN